MSLSAATGAVMDGPMRPPQAPGRTFATTRPVRLGDADPTGRMRLDALARHLQDVATDDTRDAGLDDTGFTWVVRRSAVVVTRWPRYLERVTATTFCGGVGSRWAERRTSLRGDAGGAVETAVVWARVDLAGGRPAPLPDEFHRIWAPTAGGRTVSARLHHAPPPAGVEGRPWQVRAADLDLLGHVNNAVHWAAVEDEVRRRLDGREPVAAECEYRLPVEPDDLVGVVSVLEAGLLRCWLTSPRGVHASAVVRAG